MARSEETALLESSVSTDDWLQEVERVSMRLRVQLPSDTKEWRTHLDQSVQYQKVGRSSESMDFGYGYNGSNRLRDAC